MMSFVFLMQPIGQICAYGAGLTALAWVPGNSKVDIDKMWRYVIGIGTVPTLCALAFRLYMPESGRYYFDVIRKYGQRAETRSIAESNDNSEDTVQLAKPDILKGNWNQFRFSQMRSYLFDDRRNWIILVGTSMCWLLLDIVSTLPSLKITITAILTLLKAFYGLGFSKLKKKTFAHNIHTLTPFDHRQP